MELNFREGRYSCITVIIRRFNFAHWKVLQKINSLVMVKAKSFDDGNSEMETRLQSDMGGSCL